MDFAKLTLDSCIALDVDVAELEMKMATSVVVLGGQGDGLNVAEAIYTIEMTDGSIKLEGFLNDHVAKGARIGEIAVLGSWDDWHLLPSDVMFVPAVHKVGHMVERSARMRMLAIPDARLATIVHTTACVARSVSMGPGCFVASNVTVQPGAKIISAFPSELERTSAMMPNCTTSLIWDPIRHYAGEPFWTKVRISPATPQSWRTVGLDDMQ